MHIDYNTVLKKVGTPISKFLSASLVITYLYFFFFFNQTIKHNTIHYSNINLYIYVDKL